MNRKEKWMLMIPAFWASLFDIGITIGHQSQEYWSGNLTSANEANPIGSFFMTSHVSGIFVISLLWLVLIGLLGYYLPRKLSRIFLLFVLMVHSVGASTWLLSNYGFWYVILLMMTNAVLFYVIEDMVFRSKRM
ncbi:MAG TPA: hypothetical protein VGK59_03650 [Ohtaekwangia sp.]